MERKVCIANRKNYGDTRRLTDIKFIVIHYTANDGDTDENNGKYFQNNIVNASSHYFIDDDSCTQSVPDNYTAWSVGGAKYKGTRGGNFHGICTNYNSISIELCDDVKNGEIYPTNTTITNALELTQELMAKYGITAEHVIRHFDVTGKQCPAYWVDDAKWESEFHGKLPGVAAPKPQIAPVTPSKTEDEVANEIVKGIGGWGNGAERKANVTAAGYNYDSVQAKVNTLLGQNPNPVPQPAKKSEDEVAVEIFNGTGNWGNGQDRKDRLSAAGYNYDSVQAKVNTLFGQSTAASQPAKKSEAEIADEIIRGVGGWGNGQERKDRLTAAGYNASSIQKKVNAKLK